MIKYYQVQLLIYFRHAPTVRYYFNTQVPIKIESCLPRDDDAEWLPDGNPLLGIIGRSLEFLGNVIGQTGSICVSSVLDGRALKGTGVNNFLIIYLWQTLLDTSCEKGDLPLSLNSELIFSNNKCPEKLWIMVDTRIAVYFIQTSIVRDTAGLQFPPHRSLLSRLV